MKFKILFLFSLIFNLVVFQASAQELSQGTIDSVISAYQKYKDISIPPIVVPTVIEVSFDEEFFERFDFAVFDTTKNSFEPYFFKQETFNNKIPVSIVANTDAGLVNAGNMIDDDNRTYTEFALPESTQGRSQIVLSSLSPIVSSSLTLILDNHVALPNSVEIRSSADDGAEKIVVANKKMSQQTIYFPKTASNKWTILLAYSQPLRITELRLLQENATKTSYHTLRFLSQPSHAYRIYFDPDRQVTPQVGEIGNLASDKDVVILPPVLSQNNPSYKMADIDKDGVPDIHDNCVSVANSDQQDVNTNGRGDVCDDFDRDGLINSQDNCPNTPNRDQADRDGDQIGDVCDKEESRVTERYVWIPWVGIGFAALVLIILFALTVKSLKEGRQSNQ